MEHFRLISFIFVAILATSRATRLQDWLNDHQQQPASADSRHNGQRPQSADRHKGLVSPESNLRAIDNHADKRREYASNNLDCLSTQQTFVDRHIGEASLTINTPTHDNDMRICYNGDSDSGRLSCCTQTMERQYQRAAESDFHEALQSASSYFRNLLTQNAAHYQDLFLSLLQGAHNRTERLLSEVYHLPLIDRWGPTESLFLDLQAFLRQQDVSIHHSLDTFFDELFPLVFHNNVNDPRMAHLSQDYRECLMAIRRDVYPPPFGGIPGKLTHQLAHSFKSARAFLEALNLGIDVLNVTTSVPLADGCKVALTRLQFCGHCDGLTGAAPCRGLCYNVMRGCLAHVTEVNVHWNELVDAFESLTVNMRQSYDIEEVLNAFHTRVSEAIMYAMETGVKFSHKVRERCGQPKSQGAFPDSGRGSPMNPLPSRSTLTSAMMPAPLQQNARLYTKIELFMRNVIAAKGFFSHLPDTMCKQSPFSAGLEGPCWNGDSIAPYNKSIMMKDFSAQTHNPEMTVPEQPHPSITQIIDDLQAMKKTLTSRVGRATRSTSQLEEEHPDPSQGMQRDDPNVHYGQNAPSEDWGSGNWGVGYGKNYYQGGFYGPMDDEDWYGSGSGQGSGYWPDRGHIRTSPRSPGHGGSWPEDSKEFTFDSGIKTVAPPYKPVSPGDTDEFIHPGSATTSRLSTLGYILVIVIAMYLG